MGESRYAPDRSHERSWSLPDCFAKAANAVCLLHKHWEPPLFILAALHEHPALLCLTYSSLTFLPFFLTPLFRKAAVMETILAPRGAEEILECSLAVPAAPSILLSLLTWVFGQWNLGWKPFLGHLLGRVWQLTTTAPLPVHLQQRQQCSFQTQVAPYLAWGIARGSGSARTCLVRLHLDPSCKFPSPQHMYETSGNC